MGGDPNVVARSNWEEYPPGWAHPRPSPWGYRHDGKSGKIYAF